MIEFLRVNLSMTGGLAAAYHSGAQRARVVTEAWGEQNLFCPNCSSPNLSRLRNNTKAIDYSCPVCQFKYQLKGQKSRIGDSVMDGAFDAMMEAIQADRTPNFYFMQYDLATWSVWNLLLVPSFAFPPSAIVKRKPLSPTARRAGWVGCNFDLTRIPQAARISIVRNGAAITDDEVRRRFRYVKPLAKVDKAERGWTLDVLTGVYSLGKIEFTNGDAYILADHLEKLHPDNRHIRDKIRQQLQVLRDLGLLVHVSSGVWRLP